MNSHEPIIQLKHWNSVNSLLALVLFFHGLCPCLFICNYLRKNQVALWIVAMGFSVHGIL